MSGRILICALSCVALAAFGTACGEQKQTPPAEQPKPAAVAKPTTAPQQPKATVSGVVAETVKGADKVADYATGSTQLQQKKKMESKLKNIQSKSSSQLEKELQ